MGGKNPYMDEPDSKPAVKPFTVTVQNTGQVIEVTPEKIPYGDTGRPGSLLDILLGAGIEIDHACGGVCACATCHIYVNEGLETCSTAPEEELDMIEMAPALKSNSRLSCQCVPTGEANIKVEIPGWNRNLVKEGA